MTASTCLDFDHKKVVENQVKIFSTPKTIFKTYFRLKTSNKNLYNLNKSIFQLETLQN